MKIIKYIKACVLFSLIIVIACNKNDSKIGTESIDDLINTNSDYSLYAYGVKKAHLDIFTKGGGPFTFFVPTNDAFAASGINSISDLDRIDSLSLAIILSYHFQSGNRTFYEILKGPNATMTSQTGVTQYSSRYDDGSAYINGVKLLDQGTAASNGRVYSMAELIPFLLSNTNVDIINSIGAKLMVQAIIKTSTSSTFNTNPSTIFAIPDSVMKANGYDSTSIASLSGTSLTALSNILKYHIIPQRIFKSDFKTASYTTRYTNNSISVTFNNGIFIKGKNNTLTYQASGGNNITTTGVIYLINGILKP